MLQQLCFYGTERWEEKGEDRWNDRVIRRMYLGRERHPFSLFKYKEEVIHSRMILRGEKRFGMCFPPFISSRNSRARSGMFVCVEAGRHPDFLRIGLSQ